MQEVPHFQSLVVKKCTFKYLERAGLGTSTWRMEAFVEGIRHSTVFPDLPTGQARFNVISQIRALLTPF